MCIHNIFLIIQLHHVVQQLYVSLGEPDGVAGITAMQPAPPTLSQQIVQYESLGQMADASVCYDTAIQREPDKLQHRQGLLRCRLALGELSSTMHLANSMLSHR